MDEDQTKDCYSAPPAPHEEGPRLYPIWECNVCGHKIARDLIDPVRPKRCRGRRPERAAALFGVFGLAPLPPARCRGRYVQAEYVNPDLRAFDAGEREALEADWARRFRDWRTA